MKVFIIIVGVIVLAIAIFVIYRHLTVNRQSDKLNAKRFERIKALYDKLESGQSLTEKDIFPFAQNLLSREMAFELLSDHNRTDIFPKEYYTIVKAAESHLANWLEFPTEYDACPDEIEHIKRVTFDFDEKNHFVHYEVFKYRFNEPHWAAKDGWFSGVVGPYFDDSKPYDFPHATFSRGGALEKVTADEEAKWVHENISMKLPNR